MAKKKIKRLVLLSTCVAMLIVYICFSCVLAGHGKNYTEEYKIHLALKEFDTVQEVETYLIDNKVSYSINNSIITLKDFNNIQYVIHTDNSTGVLVPSNKCMILEKLDAMDFEIVKVNKEATEDGWNEHIFLKENGITYSRINGDYFIQTTWAIKLIQTISCIVFIGTGVYLVLEYLELYFKMRKKNVQNQASPYTKQQ